MNNTKYVFYKDGMRVIDLANALGVQSSDVIKPLLLKGFLLTINDNIDYTCAKMMEHYFDCEVIDDRKKEETYNLTSFELNRFSDENKKVGR